MRTVMEVASKMKIPVHRVYDEIRAGRVESRKKGNRVMVTENGFNQLKAFEKKKGKLIPLRKYLKTVKMSVSQYYRMRYMGCEIVGIEKIGGRLFVREDAE